MAIKNDHKNVLVLAQLHHNQELRDILKGSSIYQLYGPLKKLK